MNQNFGEFSKYPQRLPSWELNSHLGEVRKTIIFPQKCWEWKGDIGVSKNRGGPQIGWFTMENPIKMDDLGGKPHYFRKHPYIPTVDGSEICVSRSLEVTPLKPDRLDRGKREPLSLPVGAPQPRRIRVIPVVDKPVGAGAGPLVQKQKQGGIKNTWEMNVHHKNWIEIEVPKLCIKSDMSALF